MTENENRPAGNRAAGESVLVEAGTSEHKIPQGHTCVKPATTSTMLEAALAAHEAGICVLPPRQDGSKRPVGDSWTQYQKQRSATEQIHGWYRDPDRTGIGYVCGKVSENLELFEFDDYPAYEAFKAAAQATGLAALVKRIEDGYSERSPGGFHWFTRCLEIAGNTELAKRALPPGPDGKPRHKVLIETRGEGGYAVAWPSHGEVNKNGVYRLLGGGVETIATITPNERRALWELAASFDEIPPRQHDEWGSAKANGALRPGDAFNVKATWRDVLEPAGWQLVFESNGKGYWRRPGKNEGWSATTGHAGLDIFFPFTTSSEFESKCAYSKFAAYAILNHGGDYKAAAKALAALGYGESTSHSSAGPGPAPEPATPSWPDPLNEAAFHGPAGDIVRAVELHTEADPAAILLNVLTCFGNAVGRGVYTTVEADRHYLNLNAGLVGETAKGRKGTSTGRVRAFFEQADPEWAERRIVFGGLSSGEGLIWAVRDRIERIEAEREKGKPTGRQIVVCVDAGIDDKRILVVESELASVLKVMAREGNTISPILRQAWDRGDLNSLVKNSPAKATNAHISIIGHITKDELLRYLNDTEAGNGFANRFIWACVRRARILPEGGGIPDYAKIVPRLTAALEGASELGELHRDQEARELWAGVYPSLSEGKPGLYGAVTARAEAQVLRLSALYAAIDNSHLIKACHLLAALAVWDYCDASARYIFGDAIGDPVADRILTALRNDPNGMDRTAISNLFGRHVLMARLDQALGILLSAGRARRERIEPDGETGRPREVWHAM